MTSPPSPRDLHRCRVHEWGERGQSGSLGPRELRATAGFDALLPAGFDIRADALYVGAQVLDNDHANAPAKLADYTVVNPRVGWERALVSRAGPLGDRGGVWALFVEARNLFDESYATRGIFAFDFCEFDLRGFRDTRAGAALSCRRDLADVNADNGAPMPRLTRIYTRTGDDGTTALGSGHRVTKDSLRIETYGTVDELNSPIGVAIGGVSRLDWRPS